MSFPRAVKLALVAGLAASMSSCVDGSDPTGIDVPHTVQLAAAPVFAVAASAGEAGTLTRARITLRRAGDSTILGSAQQDIDPSQNEWTLELTVELASSDALSVVLEAELASLDDLGVEIVEWSGRTSTFQVTASPEATVREVAMYRGPLDNLDVTGVDLALADESLLEGESTWISASLQGGGSGARVYYDALDPSVATVSGTGKVTAVQPGTARIAAIVGAVADTAVVTVEEVVLPDPGVITASVTPQMDYAAVEVVNTLGDAAGAAAIGEALSVLGSALSGGEGAASVSAFEEARAAWESYGDPVLRILDGPQLSLIEITLIHAADALGIDFG